MAFDGEEFSYWVPGRDRTTCRLGDQSGPTRCDDGTVSDMIAAGLPFSGIAFIRFDGRTFTPIRHVEGMREGVTLDRDRQQRQRPPPERAP
jgi:hypothetical protein